MFQNRGDAGEKLANKLTNYKNSNALILGLLTGGVEVAYHMAKVLNIDFSVLFTRRLCYPGNPEAAFGAIAEDGSLYLAEFAKKDLVQSTIDKVITDQMKEITGLKEKLRDGRQFPDLNQKSVILVSDGIVTAVSLQAAIAFCRRQNAKEIIVASPVADKDITLQLQSMVDDVVVLEIYRRFQSVQHGYHEYPDIAIEDLKHILDRWDTEHFSNTD